MSGTDLAYSANCLRACYAMSDADIANGSLGLGHREPNVPHPTQGGGLLRVITVGDVRYGYSVCCYALPTLLLRLCDVRY
eukprot:3934767-Rhodomonas_salina.7